MGSNKPSQIGPVIQAPGSDSKRVVEVIDSRSRERWQSGRMRRFANLINPVRAHCSLFLSLDSRFKRTSFAPKTSHLHPIGQEVASGFALTSGTFRGTAACIGLVIIFGSAVLRAAGTKIGEGIGDAIKPFVNSSCDGVKARFAKSDRGRRVAPNRTRKRRISRPS